MHNLSLTDLFCGAGGSSTGAIQAPGVSVRIAANHWQLACDVHNANHPDTDHAAVDLHQEDPTYFPRTDLLWASPECTKWSQSNTSRPLPAIEEGLFEDPLSDEAANRSRLLMFDVLRFMEHHRYRAAIVENVVDVATQAKYRLAWHTWRTELHALGYRHRVVSLNSMHAQAFGPPAPQSRDRIYIVCWREGERAPDVERILRPRAYCPRCDAVIEATQSWKNGRTVGRYRQTYLYVHGKCGQVVEPGWLPAAAAIDWSIPGERVGDRLSEKTRARIAMGIARYWGPLHVEALGNAYDATNPRHPQHGGLDSYYRAWPVEEPLRTLHTSATKALAVPVEGRDGKDARSLEEVLRTQTTRLETGMAHVPFMAELRGGSSDARPVTDPAATFCANGNHHGVVTDPAALVSPSGGTWNEDALPASEPMRALTTRDAYALVHRNNSGGAEMTTPAGEPLRTLTTAGHQALIQSGTRSGRPRVSPADLAAAQKMVPEVLFRMLRPHEVAAGMAFPSDYRWDVRDSRGRMPTARDLVKMAGNAVTPPAARDLVSVVAAGIAGE